MSGTQFDKIMTRYEYWEVLSAPSVYFDRGYLLRLVHSFSCCLVDVSRIFNFFCSGERKGESGATGREGGRFFIESPMRGGSPRRGRDGREGRSAGNLGELGGGG